ncbi:heme exporter protein CcmD [Photorhabdus luminescens]|uniref:heme exporter protein CcmD n=1 Tax=Photorhabdus akhurstii TaxID=171438 RepID=UPI000CF9EE26|nr:heme exporter protein CcmD [Photorhabdus luminescens]PQQ27534.1 heme exporter protein CcmD [Photorhabdus luminescens]
MNNVFDSWQDFFAMGGYAFYVWFAVVCTLTPLILLVAYTLWQHCTLLREIRCQQTRKQRMRTINKEEWSEAIK